VDAASTSDRPSLPFGSHQAEARIKEKAVLSAPSRMHPTWIAKQLESENDRLRANALEAAWGTKSDAAIRIFRSCVDDKNYRVAGNALIGLSRAACPETREKALAMSESPDPRLRMTAAWAMGKIGSPAFTDRLAGLVKDEERHVRNIAIRSLLAIRSKRRDAPEGFGRAAGPALPQAVVPQAVVLQTAVPDPPL
jgi:HEAT repeat protein